MCGILNKMNIFWYNWCASFFTPHLTVKKIIQGKNRWSCSYACYQKWFYAPCPKENIFLLTIRSMAQVFWRLKTDVLPSTAKRRHLFYNCLVFGRLYVRLVFTNPVSHGRGTVIYVKKKLKNTSVKKCDTQPGFRFLQFLEIWNCAGHCNKLLYHEEGQHRALYSSLIYLIRMLVNYAFFQNLHRAGCVNINVAYKF